MALTTNIKRGRVNVVTGLTEHEYYDDVEWAAVEAARQANRLPRVKTRRTEVLSNQADREVNEIIKPPQLTQALARATELTLIRAVNGAFTPEQQAEADALLATFAQTKAIRARQETALAAVAAATTVAEARAVEL